MKQTFTFLIFSLFTLALAAQISIDPGTLEATICEDDKATFVFSISNTEVNAYDVYWKIVKSEDWPAEWETQLCDDNLCYGFNSDECASSMPNAFPGSHVSNLWSLKVDPHGVIGSANLSLELYRDSGFKDLIGSTDANAVFTADCSLVSTTFENYVDQNIVLYPNPTQHSFTVKNDRNVAKVSLVNIVGKEVWTKSHNKGAVYNVFDLDKGIYLVRLFGASGNLIKTMRLNKTTL